MTEIPAEMMREVYREEVKRWTRDWKLDGMQGRIFRRNDAGDDVLIDTLTGVSLRETDDALTDMQELAGHRAVFIATAEEREKLPSQDS
jgi:hypothetical protein